MTRPSEFERWQRREARKDAIKLWAGIIAAGVLIAVGAWAVISFVLVTFCRTVQP